MQLIQAEEHKGLKLKAHVPLEGKVVAVVGRNGAGKTRLLEAIGDKIQVVNGAETISREQIIYLTTEGLRPGFTFGFDPVRHSANVKLAKSMYRQHRGKFHPDPQQVIEGLGNNVGRMGQGVTAQELTHAVVEASRTTGRDVNKLEDQDVADFLPTTAATQLGTLNVTATMLAYMRRQVENDFNEFRNKCKGASLPYWTPEAFKSRFGPPPWDALNDFLRLVLDGKYHVRPPTEDDADYEARLRREDDTEIDPSHLSSGEKTLLWLSLCIYSANFRRVGRPPRLLLLDEPDATLHPQMIQKLHIALDTMARQFGCNILFTTHSPTTIALFNGPIYRVAEDELVSVDKDIAISELLVGVDQVSIHYSNRRQVYVESQHDAQLYSTLFHLLKLWNKTPSAHISLSFVPAAPKLSVNLIQQDIETTLGKLSQDYVNALIEKLNGHGDCAQVSGAVEALFQQGNNTVYGIIDWDTKNKPKDRIYVLGLGIFYSIENAILNPLTLGLYLLHNFLDKIDLTSFGIQASCDPRSLFTSDEQWQTIADAVTKKVLGVDAVRHEIDCNFLQGTTLKFDRRYVHENGHVLEAKIRGVRDYAFLGAVAKRDPLMLDVVRRSAKALHGVSLPSAFNEVFGAIQLAR